MTTLSDFNYPFPKELVAQHPLPERAASRMMVVRRPASRGSDEAPWEHRRFSDLLEYLRPGDLLVANDAEADLISREGRLVPPLPPYIKRKSAAEFTEQDTQRYRTVYARSPGSEAAPTAGFHFSEEMIEKIRAAGVEIAFLTLQISHDTYKPIRTDPIEDHPIHGERFSIPEETAAQVSRAKTEGRRVIAVGTTTVRALESAAGAAGVQRLRAGTRQTTLYITPGFRFRVVDTLITNFHRPRSTVLVMVSAFAGLETIRAAYEEAISQKYRLFSYGDCMLII